MLPSNRPPPRNARPDEPGRGDGPVRALRAQRCGRAAACAALLVFVAGAQAQATAPAQPAAADTGSPVPAGLDTELRRMVGQAAATLWGNRGHAPRVEVTVGRLDPRLRLAPCQRIEPYLPSGMRPLGNTRVGLRCNDGRVHWNVFLPLTVKLFGRGLVARGPLPAGTVLQAQHLEDAEVDLAASTDPAVVQADAALGRTLVRGLAAGDALHQADLKARRWFDAGDVVRIVASGPGYAISAEGQALNPGIEGQAIRVRTEGGRIVMGTATASHQVDLGP